jgi:hypothetical protein
MGEVTPEQIKAKLAFINIQIRDLEKERLELTKTFLKTETDFYERFRIWFLNAKKEDQFNWIPSREKFPLFRERFIDGGDLYRYATYTIEDFLEEELDLIFNYEEYLENESKESLDTELEKNKPLFKELMDGNLYSFLFDW